MIIRYWRAVAGSDGVLAAYAKHLETTTFVEMAQLPGHLGATLARKVRGENNELVVMSFWDDMASAGHFGKGDFDDAVVKPSTQKLLHSFDLKVEYFETVVSTGLVSGHDRPGSGD
jgi:heme-degrading monooxygenase HmoA